MKRSTTRWRVLKRDQSPSGRCRPPRRVRAVLILSGNGTRALTQLKSWLALKPQAKPTVTLLEQSIQGELQRAQVMAGQARPAMPETQWPWLTTGRGAPRGRACPVAAP